VSRVCGYIEKIFNTDTAAPEIGHVERLYEVVRGERQETKLNLMCGLTEN